MKYIHPNNLPPDLNLLTPFLWFLILERFSAPGFVYCVVFATIGLIYVLQIRRFVLGKSVDVIDH